MPPSSSSFTPTSVVVRDLVVVRDGLTVLDGIDLVLAPGDRVGVVGPNGVGKSTLLQAVAGHIEPERGSVDLAPPSANVGLLPQEPDRRPDETVRALVARRTGVAAADVELDAATVALGAGEAGAEERYADALDRWVRLGAADLDARTAEAWASLGGSAAVLDQPTSTLSGGEAARASLASILLTRVDVLLLDEPTNDLDTDGLDRLGAFVEGERRPMLIVSHDRWFLERTVTEVLEIDEHRRTAARFGGGWQAYLDLRATARRHAEEEYSEYQEKRSDLTGRSQQHRLWSNRGVGKAKKDTSEKDKNIRAGRIEGAERGMHKAAKLEKAIERLDRDAVEKPWEGWQLNLDLVAAPRSGDVVARLSAAVLERGTFRLGPVDVEIGWGERVAILGPNGSGKSTLLDALLGRGGLVSGSQWMGPGVIVGELDQRRLGLPFDRPLLDGFGAAGGLLPRESRSLLAKFGLGTEHVGRTPAALSPGERTRAGLALFMARQVNCLVLDEPTNHLDLPAIEQLEQALGSWSGTLLLVTHDRRFLDAVAIDRTIDLGAGDRLPGPGAG
jgi:ATPase subunit of ABC transporter with duplicated ATPase domains